MKGLHKQVEAIRTNEPLIRTPSIKNTLKAAVVRHKYYECHSCFRHRSSIPFRERCVFEFILNYSPLFCLILMIEYLSTMLLEKIVV